MLNVCGVDCHSFKPDSDFHSDWFMKHCSSFLVAVCPHSMRLVVGLLIPHASSRTVLMVRCLSACSPCMDRRVRCTALRSRGMYDASLMQVPRNLSAAAYLAVCEWNCRLDPKITANSPARLRLMGKAVPVKFCDLPSDHI